MAKIFGWTINQRPVQADESDVYTDLESGLRYVFAENAWHQLPWSGTVVDVYLTKTEAAATYATITQLPSTATEATAGIVKQAEAVAEAAGEAPTAAEFKALLDSLKAAGILAEE